MASDFDFDYWANLAKTDPANFDKKKEEFLLAHIEKMNSENKEGLVSLAKELSKPTKGTPLEKAVSANQIMMESLQNLKQGLIGLQQAVGAPKDSVIAKYTSVKK